MIRRIAFSARPSQIGFAMMLIIASTAWVIASIALPTVMPLGSVIVKRGSRMATFGAIRGVGDEQLAAGHLVRDYGSVRYLAAGARRRRDDDVRRLRLVESRPAVDVVVRLAAVLQRHADASCRRR